mmetsp:Transcript_9689/g.32414  ORF Transcript_9689/g.32414 Transcript_9689/m.32414 type:complete len:265 (-) Transcript_9689:2779-3573(-)
MLTGSHRAMLVQTSLQAQANKNKLFPQEFLDAAERVQVDRAIKMIALNLDREKAKRAKLMRLHHKISRRLRYQQELARQLKASATDLSNKELEKYTSYRIAKGKEDSIQQQVDLDHELASLMGARAQQDKIMAVNAIVDAENEVKQADALRHKIQELGVKARKEGEEADAMVMTAHSLLDDTIKKRRMEEKASGEPAAAAQEPLLKRLKKHQVIAEREMEDDIRELARSQLREKKLLGVEGVDPISRNLESIKNVQGEANQLLH